VVAFPKIETAPLASPQSDKRIQVVAKIGWLIGVMLPVPTKDGHICHPVRDDLSLPKDASLGGRDAKKPFPIAPTKQDVVANMLRSDPHSHHEKCDYQELTPDPPSPPVEECSHALLQVITITE
jgi:hypothetical protein